MGTVDNRIRQEIGIATIPQTPTGVLIAGITLTPGQRRTMRVNTTPDSPVLSLWNFLFSVVIDDLSLDGNGQYTYLVPDGSGFISQDPKLNFVMENWTDWADSSDAANSRAYKIRFTNNDSSTHLYNVLFKAYTFANVPALTGAS